MTRELFSFVTDFIVVGEFSEQEGPVPLMILPDEDAAGGFDTASFVVRTLAADYQRSSDPSNSPDDSQVVFTIPSEDATAYIHHLTLYDIHARGYVLMGQFAALRKAFSAVSELFKTGNQLVFLQDLEHRLMDLRMTKDLLLEGHPELPDEAREALTPENVNAFMTSMEELYDRLKAAIYARIESNPRLALFKPFVETYERESAAGAYTPQVRSTLHKVAHFDRGLRALSEICLSGFATGVALLRRIQRKFSASSLELLLDSEEKHNLRPLETGLCIGGSLVTNFANCIAGYGANAPYGLVATCRHNGWDDADADADADDVTRCDRSVVPLALRRSPSMSSLDSNSSHRSICLTDSDPGERALGEFDEGSNASRATSFEDARSSFDVFDTPAGGGQALLSPALGGPHSSLGVLGIHPLRRPKNSTDSLASGSSAASPSSPASRDAPSPLSNSASPFLTPETFYGRLWGHSERRTAWNSQAAAHAQLGGGGSGSFAGGESGSGDLGVLNGTALYAPVLERMDVLQFRARYSFAPHVVYALLSGRLVVVHARPASRAVVKSLVSALSLFVPGLNRSVQVWRTKGVGLTELATLRLVGLSKAVPITPMLYAHATVLDFDDEELTGTPYTGGSYVDKLLDAKKEWPSLDSFVAHVSTVYAEMGMDTCIFYALCCVGLQPAFAEPTADFSFLPPDLRTLLTERAAAASQSGRSLHASYREDEAAILAQLNVRGCDIDIVRHLARTVMEAQLVHLRASSSPSSSATYGVSMRLSCGPVQRFVNEAN
ncbi:uncharacterized protein AMSG_02469 [Thecamonas trahens ATCC 50062]|uniref:UDENN FLCN/SMCR8-type domain-containing protein n=1 Tax=Thecamonas trahens ATCC 50062 TaxID=461836 RepID=A0A0L0D506_THETB|nr:hypothetical protein AMSG_02469 [Thecamonas trahens ATCC 50062]KNC47452.1 hypothetical protein AMSG_02469 [Thecamonas trahens ATCC 50062]|eukprot:XP_013759388.1 hypothetical protein AMSG_02469 [Thecamonas trahens ATCC 50062]